MRRFAGFLALFLFACGGGERGKLAAATTQLEVFVEVESAVEELAAIQVTVRPKDGSADLVLDMRPPTTEGGDWSQLMDNIPAGEYAARASALDAGRRLLFHSVDTEQFRVYAGQTTVLKLLLRDPKGGEEIWDPHFVSVRVEGTPAQGSESAIHVRAAGGEGELRLAGSGDGIFGAASGDPRAEEGAQLGWTPLQLGPNTIELELLDDAERRATTTLEVNVGCPEGLTLCNGSCVDTDEDPLHCGSCNHGCASGACVFGLCAGAGDGGSGGGDSGGSGGDAGTGGTGGVPGGGGSGGDPGTGGTGGGPGSGGGGGDPGTGGAAGEPGSGGAGGDPGAGGTGGDTGTGGDPGAGGTGGGQEPEPVYPVPPGNYLYDPVISEGLISPYAGAWHPGGSYALVASNKDKVFRYDAATHGIQEIGSAGADFRWRGIAFTEDGSSALLVGYDEVGSQRTGRLFVWDDATGALTERPSEQGADTEYQRIKRSPEGELWLLASRRNPYRAILWPVDPSGKRGSPRETETHRGCDDLAFATDKQGRRAVVVGCGINGGDLWHLDGADNWIQQKVTGNILGVSSRPQGDYALAIYGSNQGTFHRFEEGNWLLQQGAELVLRRAIAFSSDGARAIVLARRHNGVGRIYEYRHDLLTHSEIYEVHIPNMGSAPFPPTGDPDLNEALWQPGCDGGIILAGRENYPSSGFIIRFDITNGVPCP